MASKLPFLIGLTGGYVLGTRAGRAQYEKIKAAAGRVAVKERLFGGSGQSNSTPVAVPEAQVRPLN